ncbi:MAG: MFS transporter [Hyphomicrobiaceae bacterium]
MNLLRMPATGESDDPRPALKLSLMYGAMFVIFGVALTYLPVWLNARGLSPADIAVATSAPMFLRLVATPAIGFVADRSQAHRTILLFMCLAGLSLMTVVGFPPAGYVLMALVGLMLFTIQSLMPLADTITLAHVRAQQVDYGRVRLWGSLTFVLASYAAGYATEDIGAHAILWLLIAGTALTVVAVLLLPRREPGSRQPDSTRPKLSPADIIAIFSRRTFALFLLCAGSIQASHAMFYVFGVIHWRAQDLSPGFIGTLWAIAIAAEIALFWWAPRISMMGGELLMISGAVSGIVRWLAMSADPSPLMLVPLQVLHAGTFAATHLGAMQWIARNVPGHVAGSAQALLTTFSAGIAMSSATLMSGPLYQAFGGGAYAAMAVLCVLGLLAGITLNRTQSAAALEAS